MPGLYVERKSAPPFDGLRCISRTDGIAGDQPFGNDGNEHGIARIRFSQQDYGAQYCLRQPGLCCTTFNEFGDGSNYSKDYKILGRGYRDD